MLKGHQLAVLDMALSPDGRRVATASTDKTGGIWDLESGQEILMLKGHTDAVLSVRFSSDGRRLITASSDRTIHVPRLGCHAAAGLTRWLRRRLGLTRFSPVLR